MERWNDESGYFTIDTLETGFDQLIVECVNAVDEAGHYTKLDDGRDMLHTEWTDAEDMRCYLRAFNRIDPRTVLSPPEKQKFRTDYFFSRETSMPHIPNQRYYFTSVRKSVELCDQSGVGIPNEDPADGLKYLTIVLGSLQARPTRQEAGGDLRQIATNFMIDHNIVVKALIKRIDDLGRHAKNRPTIEKIVQLIIEKEPILHGETDVVRSAIEAERLRLKTTRLELE